MISIEIIIFLGFAILFIGLRLHKYREASMFTILMSTMAGICYAFVVFFLLNPVQVISNTTYSSSVLNATSNTVVTSSLSWATYQPEAIIMTLIVWELFVVILIVVDLPAVFGGNKLPRMPPP